MLDKTEMQKLDSADQQEPRLESRVIPLESGRKVIVRSEGNEEFVEVASPEGQLELKVRLTEEGPVISLESVRLEMKAEESISLKSRKVQVHAENEVSLVSDGTLNIGSEKDMDIRSPEDVWVTGKMIYLNCDPAVVQNPDNTQGTSDGSQVVAEKGD